MESKSFLNICLVALCWILLFYLKFLMIQRTIVCSYKDFTQFKEVNCSYHASSFETTDILYLELKE